MKFRVFFFIMLAASVLAFSQDFNDEWYQGRPIRDIIFTGTRNVSQPELDALMNPYKGRNFSDNVFLEMQGRLYALEYFDRIEPSIQRSSTDDVVIRFNVIERPIIGRINFIGNSGLRVSELRDVITSRVNSIYNQAKVRTDIEAIIAKYLEKGYPNVTVTSSESQSGDTSVTLNFHITENDKISISRIEFIGNNRFSASTLRSQLSLKTKALFNDGAFSEAKLLADREKITKYYHDRGYIDAIVRDVTRTFETDNRGASGLVLTFMIEEGSEFRFGGVTFDGNFIFSTEQLSKLVSSREGDTVNMTRLESDKTRIVDLYFENGYIFNSFDWVPHKNNQTNTFSYHLSIAERSRAYIENITIVGNIKTRTEVILREIPLEPGDVFSKTKIMDALRNLYNLQFFSVVFPDMLPGSSENLMELVFTVEEQPTIDLQFGLTFSGSADPDSFPISGLVKWSDRNLAGTGNELGIELNSSVIDSSTVSVNYLHRWAFGLPLSLGADLSANYSRRYSPLQNRTFPFNGDEEFAFPEGFMTYDEYERYNRMPTRDYLLQYEQWYLSLGLSTGYRWETFMGLFSINGGIRFGLINNSYDDMYIPFDPALRDGNNTWTPKNSIWLGLSLDRRDIFYDPSSGYFLYQRFGIFGLFNNEREHYIRSDTKAQYYVTLFDISVTENWNFKSVLAMHVGLSTIVGQPGRNSDSRIPAIEDANKLAIDGMFVGRGWSSAFRRKGLLLFDSWIELRFPLVRGILAWDFFLDAAGVETEQGYYFGSNSGGNNNFTFENLRFSWGGGLRFTLPQFPIRLSLVKRFRFYDGNIVWEPGALFGDPNDPSKGLDLVMSFVISY
ncbi:MAG: outer membrane protein assembly factor BamA [Treponema sp.]|nr:outer membrane protein assembly factor BamA [Treponema sp.]